VTLEIISNFTEVFKKQMKQIIKLTITVAFAFILLLIATTQLFSQSTQKKGKKWFVSGSVGMAVLTGEISNEFEPLKNEFEHQPGWAADIKIGRSVGRHFEPALRFSSYIFSGTSDKPQFSANGNHPALPRTLHNLPVEYRTLTGSVSGIIRYYIKEIPRKHAGKFRFDPFIEAGGGVIYMGSQLSYQTKPPGAAHLVVFEKGTGNQPPPAVGQAVLGLGTKLGNPGKWHLGISYNVDIVNYAVLDAVHNYNADGIRNHAKGIVSKVMAEIIIPVGKASKNSGSGGTNPRLPWSPVN